MDPQDLEHRFAFHAADSVKRDQHSMIRNACLRAAGSINEICPDSREKSLAITHLEEAMMWGNAALARNDKE